MISVDSVSGGFGRIVAVAAAVAVFTPAAPSQRWSTSVEVGSTKYVDGHTVEQGSLRITAGSTTATWRWSTRGGFGEAACSVPFTLAGDGADLGDGTILVCGFDRPTHSGHLLRLRLDTQTKTISTVSSAVFRGVDVFQVAWSENGNELYLRTHDNEKAIFCAEWVLASPLPASIHSFTKIVDVDDIPELSNVEYIMRPRYGAPGVELAAPWHCSSAQDLPRWHVSPGRCEKVVFDEEAAQSAFVVMRESDFASVTGPFFIKGPPGACSLRDVTTDSVVCTVTLPEEAPGVPWWDTDDDLASTWTSVTPPSLLVSGHGYQWEHLDSTIEPSLPFFPIIRYGNPSTKVRVGGGRVSLAPGHVFSPSLAVGDLAIVGLDIGTDAPCPLTFRCYLNVALADPSGTADPVVDLGNGSFLLYPQTTIGPDPLTVSDVAGTHYPFSMDDAGFTGRRMLWQWLVVHEASGAVVATDVFGSHVLPSDTDPAAMPAGTVPGWGVASAASSVPLLAAAGSSRDGARIAALAEAVNLPVCSTFETRAILSLAIDHLCGR